MTCVVCGSSDLYLFDRYAYLKRVTSDTKLWPAGGKLFACRACTSVQKNADKEWLAEIDLIYHEYEAYAPANGEEQAIFNQQGSPEKRSNALTRFIYNQIGDKTKKRKILDYGCGNGEFLSTFSTVFEQSELFGVDLSQKYIARLQAIPKFQHLYHVDDECQETFDLISIIHALEHLVTPIDTLVKIRKQLKKNGILFIQVPNLLENPFDILIADHLSHFSPATLTQLLLKTGYKIISLATDVVSKEISVLAVPDENNTINFTAPRQAHEVIDLVNKYIDFILTIIDEVKGLQAAGQFGIFGTAIGATWLYNYFPDATCFVDEDPNRVGKTHFGKPIHAPQDIYDHDIPIYIPLALPIAEKIINRHSKLGGRFVSPPKIL